MNAQTRTPLPPRTIAIQKDKKFEALDENNVHPLVNAQTASDIWIFLIVFRVANSLLVWTFFQPDEYFQSLEPAWQMAFGSQSGAWITWEWEHQLRSSLHPALFAALYYVVDKPMELLDFFPQFRAMILSSLPNIVQGVFAAMGDYYTWKFSEKIYGVGSNTTWAAFFMTLFSPWQWFCSTRTFSNSLETVMTITALYFWPWEMTVDSVRVVSNPTAAKTSSSPTIFQSAGSIRNLRVSLFLALTACVLRPTNLMIWFCILMPTLTRLLSSSSPAARVSFSDYVVLIREFVVSSMLVLALSFTSDRLYFGFWTFPPYQWLTFNISLDLATFYGRNDWHYYLSQGLPLLLTTYLPFTLVAVYQSTFKNDIRFLLITTVLTTIGVLSLVSHKEVRFIYPLLPLLHILTAPVLSNFFTINTPSRTSNSHTQTAQATKTKTHRKPLLLTLLLLNLSIAAYTTLIHQRSVLTVLSFLRHEYESLALDMRGVPLSSPLANQHARPQDNGIPLIKSTDYVPSETFVGFLMPCHSTPWRSQLFYPGLRAWALTCEPPVDLAAGSEERRTYRDEADRFYDSPLEFLKREINTPDRPWPRYIVGFQGIAPILKEYYASEAGMPGFDVVERWRGFNSHWHDDSRRRGDVVVWEFVDEETLRVREEREREEQVLEKARKGNEEWLRDWEAPEGLKRLLGGDGYEQ